MAGPNFICIGAQKAGTGWLYEQLRAHPDFWMPPIKEIHYFDRDLRTARPSAGNRFDEALKEARDVRDREFIEKARRLFADPRVSVEKYAELFEGHGPLISGDITPGYSTLPAEMAATITGSFPEVEIVFLARDPVERAWSQISMWVRHKRIPRFDSTDTNAVLRVLADPGVMSRSYPSKIVRLWKRHLRPEKFHLYFFDDLKMEPDRVRHSILQALGGDSTKRSGELLPGHNTKARLEKLPLPETVRQAIARFFREELEDCAAELGGRATDWPSRYGFS